MIKTLKSGWQLFLIASLTLGLAPFNPPHIWGKIQWITGGGAISGDHPMQFMDWFDLLFHGLPWILLLISSIIHTTSFIKKSTSSNP